MKQNAEKYREAQSRFDPPEPPKPPKHDRPRAPTKHSKSPPSSQDSDEDSEHLQCVATFELFQNVCDYFLSVLFGVQSGVLPSAR